MALEGSTYFKEGMNTHRSGIGREGNPYPRWTSQWIAWLAGWNVSEEEHAVAEQEHSHDLSDSLLPC